MRPGERISWYNDSTMNATIKTNSLTAAVTTPGSQITFLNNTYLDRELRNYVRSFFGKESHPVVVTYGDPVEYKNDRSFTIRDMGDGRAIRVDNKHPRLEGPTGTVFITVERKKA